MDREPKETSPGGFFGVSPYMIFPSAYGNFSIFLKFGNHHILYAKDGEAVTERHKAILYENGVEEVYIRTDDKPQFDDYVERNLSRILLDDNIPLPVRSRIFYSCAVNVLERALEAKLSLPLTSDRHRKLVKLVESSVSFLCRENVFKTLGSLMSHDRKVYTHSTNVFLYTLAMLETYSLPEEEKVHIGLGALLHDIGKSQIPAKILNKPGRLNAHEWEILKTHPVKGLALCSAVPLDQSTIHCILFHHEQCDGRGYPTGLTGANIPLPVKVVNVANRYDLATSPGPRDHPLTPFQGLTKMKEEMQEEIDMDVFRRLVMVLSGAGLVQP
ncbi:MAG TPA: HD domain-containing protein [Syntrophobacteraceae bacterium]|nr:HD domain-containing protein [Syntrophobacteraceae bacterium]